MKIECSAEEFATLQNKSEVASLRHTLEITRGDLEDSRNETERVQITLNEAMQRLRDMEVTLSNQASNFLTQDRMVHFSKIFKAMAEGNKIAAIKDFRNVFHCGLKEAKDIVCGEYPEPNYRY